MSDEVEVRLGWDGTTVRGNSGRVGSRLSAQSIRCMFARGAGFVRESRFGVGIARGLLVDDGFDGGAAGQGR